MPLGVLPLVRDEAAKANLRAVAGIPMRWEGLRLGALDIYDADPNRWAADDIAGAAAQASGGRLTHANPRPLVGR